MFRDVWNQIKGTMRSCNQREVAFGDAWNERMAAFSDARNQEEGCVPLNLESEKAASARFGIRGVGLESEE